MTQAIESYNALQRNSASPRNSLEARDFRTNIAGSGRIVPHPGRCYTPSEKPTVPDITQSAPILRFVAFELDLRAGELRKRGLRIKLQEKPLQILALLLEHPGEVVTREQLRQHLWAAATFVDFDHSVNSAVNKLREALGDSAENPRFIETLPRHGYRFVATLPAPSRENMAQPRHCRKKSDLPSCRWRISAATRRKSPSSMA